MREYPAGNYTFTAEYDGTFTYEYTVTETRGTYDVTLTALENDNYLYNAKYMTLKVN